ncbi:MAG: anthranilate phosphoribosyltransferase [Acidobacteria bacterium]|nr:anthranilate phosphoribosyltransferase [Acidobacteriota bacterium]
MTDYLKKFIARKDLTEEEASDLMRLLVDEQTTDAQVAALLMALAFKGETAEEITGLARVMNERSVPLRTRPAKLIDTAGTGGGIDTFNISTAASFVIAGAGLPVAKHANMAVDSHRGSSDVLRQLGFQVEVMAEKAERCLNEVGICFLFASFFHPALNRVGRVRREIGLRTVFDLLGPVTNPARAQYQIIGVYHEDLTDLIARVLRNLGTERAWVVHGADGLDEISISDVTRISEVREDRVMTFYLSPEDLGLELMENEQLKGGDAEHNARILRGVLDGSIRDGPREVVLLNAGAGLFVAGMAPNLRAGVDLARDAIDSGKALKKLEGLKELTCSG